MKYIADNTFTNSATVPDGFDVTVVDRSGYESTLLDNEPKEVVMTEETPAPEIIESEFVSGSNETKEDEVVEVKVEPVRTNTQRLIGGRNAPCVCGSGKKFKKCCWYKYSS